MTREVDEDGGRWRMLRETPPTLLAATQEEFDRAVKAKIRDLSRQWQLDVLSQVCADHLLVRHSHRFVVQDATEYRHVRR